MRMLTRIVWLNSILLHLSWMFFVFSCFFYYFTSLRFFSFIHVFIYVDEKINQKEAEDNKKDQHKNTKKTEERTSENENGESRRGWHLFGRLLRLKLFDMNTRRDYILDILKNSIVNHITLFNSNISWMHESLYKRISQCKQKLNIVIREIRYINVLNPFSHSSVKSKSSACTHACTYDLHMPTGVEKVERR